MIETYASQAGIVVVLMQEQHPVVLLARCSKNRMWSMYDKELLAVVYVIEKWYHYLSVFPFTIRTDQKSLRYLMEQRLSTPSQFSWLSKLMGMTYEIQYKKGGENGVVDALSRATHGEFLHMCVSC